MHGKNGGGETTIKSGSKDDKWEMPGKLLMLWDLPVEVKQEADSQLAGTSTSKKTTSTPVTGSNVAQIKVLDGA